MKSLDIESLPAILTERLPLQASWVIAGMAWAWNFIRARQPLQPPSAKDIVGGTIPAEWRPIYIFGEQQFAKGCGASPFVGVHVETGRVHGLDIERESESIYLLNSSVPQFIETFFLFDSILEQNAKYPICFANRVLAVDPEAFDQSEWKNAINEIEGLPKSA